MATGWEDNTYPTINTDLIAQTVGNLAVNIAAQAIGNIAMDLTAQTLAKITSRNKKGSFHSENVATLNAATAEFIQHSVTGQGIIQGVYLYGNHATSGIASSIKVTIDTIADFIMTWSAMNTYKLDACFDDLVKLVAYDTTNHIYKLIGFKAVTFETNFSIKYTPSVANGTIYSLVHYTTF